MSQEWTSGPMEYVSKVCNDRTLKMGEGVLKISTGLGSLAFGTCIAGIVVANSYSPSMILIPSSFGYAGYHLVKSGWNDLKKTENKPSLTKQLYTNMASGFNTLKSYSPLQRLKGSLKMIAGLESLSWAISAAFVSSMVNEIETYKEIKSEKLKYLCRCAVVLGSAATSAATGYLGYNFLKSGWQDLKGKEKTVE